MNKPTYNIKTSRDGLRYYFKSLNDDKIIQKAVIYLETEGLPNIYQLVFGDLQPDGQVDFLSVSDNKDMKNVLSTVVKTLALFFEKYPEKGVFFTGSTLSRTRLYRATIAKFIETTELYYQVFGLLEDNSLEVFDKSHTYIAYLIQKKDED
ncbi:MAG: hypothetical protein MUF58_04360 [Arcicella sp.]|jgi:hypothetical protein|nr:hypothetical protein [Arcicella sp.]